MTTATMTRSVVEPRPSEQFAEELLDITNHACLAMMISIGHRTGLFDAMENLEPSTSEQIAEAAGLQERYVREWLGALVVGRVICHNPDDGTFWLPVEHAALLTRSAEPENIAATMQWISVLGGVESNVVDAFKHGGGVHYHCFHRFHDVMAAESSQTIVSALFEHILPLEDGLTDQLEAGINVLDIGCGAGWALCALAQAYPNSRFTGYDLCEDAIDKARGRALEMGLSNIRFEARDVTEIVESNAFDVITGFDVIHDQKAPSKVLSEVYDALKPDGLFLMQDINASRDLHKNLDHPLGTLLYTISTMHCMTVSLAQGGAGLGTCWGEETAVEMLADAGFKNVRVEKLDHDIQNNFYLVRKR